MTYRPSDDIDRSNPVSINLAATESTTVPTGETWVITAVGAGASSGGEYVFQINSDDVRQWEDDTHSGEPLKTVVTDGDTLSAVNGPTHIGGFKV